MSKYNLLDRGLLMFIFLCIILSFITAKSKCYITLLIVYCVITGENISSEELLWTHLEWADSFHWDVSTTVQAHEDPDPWLR